MNREDAYEILTKFRVAGQWARCPYEVLTRDVKVVRAMELARLIEVHDGKWQATTLARLWCKLETATPRTEEDLRAKIVYLDFDRDIENSEDFADLSWRELSDAVCQIDSGLLRLASVTTVRKDDGSTTMRLHRTVDNPLKFLRE